MFMRRLYPLLLALMLYAAGGCAHAANTYTFDGSAVAPCTLSGATYSCAKFPLPAGDDGMVIASGFTVTITGDVNFGYNNKLAMSGSAVLATTGDLNIGGIKGSNLNITGGTLIAGDTFSVGAQNQTLTADVQAVTANLGTGSTLKITGDVSATGNIYIASHATIVGNISGATVSTNSPVALTGDIAATKSFTLASGSSVTGNVTAGTLTIDASESTIYGNATIASGVFEWHGRVTQTIYCTGGTAAGRCDCVTNHSGYPVNSTYGPHCQGNAVTLDHFLIRYDPTGSVCAPATVSITACADATCKAKYGGGANVTLAPTGQTVTVDPSGSVQASVTWPQVGINTLGVTGAATVNPTACWSSSDAGPGANCQVNVGKAGYVLSLGTAPGYTSDTPQTLTISALQQDTNDNLQQGTNGACVPLFKSVTRNATFSCAYANPSTGTLPVLLNGKILRGQTSGTGCDGGGPSIPVTFDANGQATLPLQYADAGQVKVTIADGGAGSPGTAKVTPIFVPARFRIALPGAPYVAGKVFKPTVTALNANGNPTPNFGRESPGESANLAAVPCRPGNGGIGVPLSVPSSIAAGVQTFEATWSETGNIDLVASLTSGNYLGSKMVPTAASTNTMAAPDCTGDAGPFSPAYFTFDIAQPWTRTATTTAGTTPQYYSGEPAIQFTVTARNAQGEVTKNYTNSYAHDLKFIAIDPAGGPLVGGAGTFSRSPGYPASDLTSTAQVRAKDFGTNGTAPGTAPWTGSYTFAKSPTAPTRLRVRVSELPSLPYPASSAAIPADVKTGVEPIVLIRSGRVRMPSRFGSAGTLLKIPVSLEYYTGQTWVLNSEDSTTAIPPGAVSVGTAMGKIETGLTAFANGQATLSLTPTEPPGRGSIPFALDLGSATTNTSCQAAKLKMTDATGAALPFLRSVDPACTAAGAVDPSALATFGVYPPETKRVIHVREVFQ